MTNCTITVLAVITLSSLCVLQACEAQDQHRGVQSGGIWRVERAVVLPLFSQCMASSNKNSEITVRQVFI